MTIWAPRLALVPIFVYNAEICVFSMDFLQIGMLNDIPLSRIVADFA